MSLEEPLKRIEELLSEQRQTYLWPDPQPDGMCVVDEVYPNGAMVRIILTR